VQTDDIPEVPKVPEDILQRAREGKLCFFLGSGLSKLLGCKGWKDLSNNLTEMCFERNYINFRQKESIMAINEPKKIITICRNIFRDNHHENDFYKQIKKCLKTNKAYETQNIYKVLSELFGIIPALYLTTNIDRNFDSTFPGSVLFTEKDFSPNNILPDRLYKIHGTIEHPNTTILTVQDYLDRYRKGEFHAFLAAIFSEYSIIFLGYGLEEFEILDFLVTTMDRKQMEPKHCILLPYYKEEKYLQAFDADYFKPLGIKVVGYKKDVTGYAQLYTVIKKWKKELIGLTDMQYEAIKDMEEMVDKLE